MKEMALDGTMVEVVKVVVEEVEEKVVEVVGE